MEQNKNMSGRGKLEFVSADDLLSLEFPRPEFLLEGLVETVSLVLLAGEAGVGKSLMLANLALAVSTGHDEYLNRKVMKKGSVLVINNELGLSILKNRIECMKNALPSNADLSNLYLTSSFPPPIKSCYDDLTQYCEQLHPQLIIIDSLYFALGENDDESSSTEMRKLMRFFAWLRDHFSCTVVIAHHTRKGGGGSRMHLDEIRGSSVFAAAVDTALMLRRSGAENGRCILKPIKFRNQPDANRKAIELSLNVQTLWFENVGEVAADEYDGNRDVSTAADEIDFVEIFGDRIEMQAKDIIQACDPLGYDEKTIRRVIKECVKNQSLLRVRHGVYSLSTHDDNTGGM